MSKMPSDSTSDMLVLLPTLEIVRVQIYNFCIFSISALFVATNEQ